MKIGEIAVQGQNVDGLWNCWETFWKGDLMRKGTREDHSLSLSSKTRNFDNINGIKERMTQGQNLRANCKLDGKGNPKLPQKPKFMENRVGKGSK